MRRATQAGVRFRVPVEISIHALHEESDQSLMSTINGKAEFQSTLSMRRATDVAGGHRLQQ